jgi:hypothetical protein
VIEFENEKLQTFTGKTFEKRENFEKDVADFLTKLIDFHTKPTELKSNEEEKIKAEVKKLAEEVLSLKSKKTAEIGDIAYSDGSVFEEYDRTKIPIGIVIEVTNGRATKIVSIEETYSDWHTALEWCKNYTDASGSRNWCLPNKEELNQLYKVKNAVNTAINKIKAGNRNAKSLGGIDYWSSSQFSNDYAWYQRFSDGYQDGYYKYDSISVRAVRAF